MNDKLIAVVIAVCTCFCAVCATYAIVDSHHEDTKQVFIINN